jgi:hypothetical protein
MQRVENRQELTQEDVDEILVELIEEIGEIRPNQEGCLSTLYLLVAFCPNFPTACVMVQHLALFFCLLGI